MKKYTNGEKIIEVAKGAYEMIYEPLGYYPIELNEDINKLTVVELRELAKQKNIDIPDKIKKEEIIKYIQEYGENYD
ncbi:hypothetical protein ACR77J_16635 [Tissierella praeacuta]|uniref:hypothetical protein n=1 Tax=Tissierella praeacuta TaxID=43131 RepID=UPI003DA2FEF4